MKEFNLILDKVSQALGTTVDNVIKLYPHLRTEYSWYYLCDTLQYIISGALPIILSLIGVFIVPSIIFNKSGSKEYKISLIILKCLLVIIVVLTVLFLAVIVIKGFMCPDILIIERIIKWQKHTK